jgi:hydrogenase maturation protease
VSRPRATVVGVGNAHRCDDGVGPALVAHLAQDPPPGAVLEVCDGEPARLLDIWSRADLAVVVDSLVCSAPRPGRIHRTMVGDLHPAAGGGTHSLGIPGAIELASALGRAPARFVVFAVEVAEVGHGLGLSPEVEAALPELERLVRAEISAEPALP